MSKIRVDRIKPDPGQPRKLFDLADLQELAASIKANGLLQPILVRPAEKKGEFYIVAGERRWRAQKLLIDAGEKGFTQIECSLAGLPGKPMKEVTLRVKQIVENVVRADMTPLEEAHAFQNLLELGLDEQKAASHIGIPLSKFQRSVSLLRLEPQIAKLLAAKQIDVPQAYQLARLPRHEDQMQILRLLNRGELGKWKSFEAAIDAKLEGVTQEDFFGPGAPAATEKEVAELNAMEQKIERVAGLLSAGWSKGACIVANKVSPDRARHMADRLAAIRLTVRTMEAELRAINAQAKIALET